MTGIASERDFLALIDTCFPPSLSGSRSDEGLDSPQNSPEGSRHGVLLGRGDDAAVIACPDTLCISTDLFVENVHFRRPAFSLEDIGYKALAVNISDMAAMAARPLGFSLGLTLPRGMPEEEVRAMLSGMADPAAKWDIPLTGGDLSIGPCLSLCITIWGEPCGKAFLARGTAQPGRLLVLIGDVGLSRIGLALFEEDQGNLGRYPDCVAAHLRPRVLLPQAAVLGREPGATALMDVSDGLAADLPRLLGDHLGADIRLDPEALHPELLAFCAERNLDPLHEALLGGEDYALLAVVDEQRAEHCIAALRSLDPAVPVRVLGTVTREPGMTRRGKPLALAGFDHFTAS